MKDKNEIGSDIRGGKLEKVINWGSNNINYEFEGYCKKSKVLNSLTDNFISIQSNY